MDTGKVTREKEERDWREPWGRGIQSPGSMPWTHTWGEGTCQTDDQGVCKVPRVPRAPAEERLWGPGYTILGNWTRKTPPRLVRTGLQDKRPQLTLLSIGL